MITLKVENEEYTSRIYRASSGTWHSNSLGDVPIRDLGDLHAEGCKEYLEIRSEGERGYIQKKYPKIYSVIEPWTISYLTTILCPIYRDISNEINRRVAAGTFKKKHSPNARTKVAPIATFDMPVPQLKNTTPAAAIKGNKPASTLASPFGVAAQAAVKTAVKASLDNTKLPVEFSEEAFFVGLNKGLGVNTPAVEPKAKVEVKTKVETKAPKAEKYQDIAKWLSDNSEDTKHNRAVLALLQASKVNGLDNQFSLLNILRNKNVNWNCFATILSLSDDDVILLTHTETPVSKELDNYDKVSRAFLKQDKFKVTLMDHFTMLLLEVQTPYSNRDLELVDREYTYVVNRIRHLSKQWKSDVDAWATIPVGELATPTKTRLEKLQTRLEKNNSKVKPLETFAI